MMEAAARDTVRPAVLRYVNGTPGDNGEYGIVGIDERTSMRIHDPDSGGFVRLEGFSGGTVD